MNNKLIGIIVCVLIIIGSFPLTATMIFSDREVQGSLDDVRIREAVGQYSLAQQQNILTFGCSGEAISLDPADITDSESVARTDSIFEGLVEFKSGSTEIQACLATSWTFSPDGKNITFTLRQGVKFHDGTDFNADAVVFSFERQYNASHPYHQYGEWAYWGYMFNDIQRVEKIDEYTVKIVLSRKNAAIMTSLAMFTVTIVSPSNVETWKQDAFKHPVGTGPFKFMEWVAEDHIKLEANQDYWRGRPTLDTLVFQVIPDPLARLQALQNNIIQGMEYPDPASFKTIQADSNLTLLEAPGMNIGYLAINNGYGYTDTNQNGVHDPDEPWEKTPGYFEPLTNKLVRKAINLAINKTSIVTYAYNRTAIVAKNGMPPFMLGYNDAIEDYPYDPEKARELLKEAGYPNGFSTTLWVMPIMRPYMFNPSGIGTAIQAYLEAVNIHVEIYQVDWSTYLAKTQAGEHPMCLLGWTGDTGDPDNFMNPLYGANSCSIGTASNVAFYNNTEVQELLTAAVQTYDTQERAKYYEQAQELIHEDAPFVYLAHANQYLVFRSTVKGFVIHPTGRLFFYPVGFETIPDEPDGKIRFTATSTGPCLLGWGYGISGESTADAYVEPGKGIVFTFGSMPYHSLLSPFFTNYLIKGNVVDALWAARGKTLLRLNWQHADVQHHLQVMCTPVQGTTGTFFTNQTSYIIGAAPTYPIAGHELNCMAFTGSYRNGSQTGSISGFAALLAVGEEDASSQFPEPVTVIWLLKNTDGGDLEPFLMMIWSKNGWTFNDITIEKANTFYVNFWV